MADRLRDGWAGIERNDGMRRDTVLLAASRRQLRHAVMEDAQCIELLVLHRDRVRPRPVNRQHRTAGV